MSKLSAVGRGRKYELACHQLLQNHLAMRLTRSGGAGDQGVDLRGSWKLKQACDVIVQCKHYAKPVGPSTVREMEGTASYYDSVCGPPLVSIICSRSGFSPASWKRAIASRVPLLLLHLDPQEWTDNSKTATTGEKCSRSLECQGVWKNMAFDTVTDGLVFPRERFMRHLGQSRRILELCCSVSEAGHK